MPIKLTIDRAKNRLVATYSGRISDQELVSTWRDYYEGGIWVPGLPELNDLSAADVREVSANAIGRLAEYAATFLNARQASPVKVAIYAPDVLPFGLARMYEALAAGSPELIRVFKDLQAAETWLETDTDE